MLPRAARRRRRARRCRVADINSGAEPTQYVLLECVDYAMLRKRGHDAEAAIREVVASKAGRQPMVVWLFEAQEAAAVLMPDRESAILAK